MAADSEDFFKTGNNRASQVLGSWQHRALISKEMSNLEHVFCVLNNAAQCFSNEILKIK